MFGWAGKIILVDLTSGSIVFLDTKTTRISTLAVWVLDKNCTGTWLRVRLTH